MTLQELREYAAEQRELAAKAAAAGWVTSDMDTVDPGMALYGSFFADSENYRRGLAAYRAAQERFDRLLASAAVAETAPPKRRSDEIACGPARAATVSPIASAVVRSQTAPAPVVAPAISLTAEERSAARLMGVAEEQVLALKRRQTTPVSKLSAEEERAARLMGVAEERVVDEKCRLAAVPTSMLSAVERAAARALGLAEAAVVAEKHRQATPSVSKLSPAEARAARALGLTEDAVLGQKRRMGKP